MSAEEIEQLLAFWFLLGGFLFFVYLVMKEQQVENDETINLLEHLWERPERAARSTEVALIVGSGVALFAGTGAGFGTFDVVAAPLTEFFAWFFAAFFLLLGLAISIIVVGKNWKLFGFLAGIAFLAGAISRDRLGRPGGIAGGSISTLFFLGLVFAVIFFFAYFMKQMGHDVGWWIGYVVAVVTAVAAGVAVAVLAGALATVLSARVGFAVSVWFAPPERQTTGEALRRPQMPEVLEVVDHYLPILPDDGLELRKPSLAEFLRACSDVIIWCVAIVACFLVPAVIASVIASIGWLIPPIRPIVLPIALIVGLGGPVMLFLRLGRGGKGRHASPTVSLGHLLS